MNRIKKKVHRTAPLCNTVDLRGFKRNVYWACTMKSVPQYYHSQSISHDSDLKERNAVPHIPKERYTEYGKSPLTLKGNMLSLPPQYLNLWPIRNVRSVFSVDINTLSLPELLHPLSHKSASYKRCYRQRLLLKKCSRDFCDTLYNHFFLRSCDRAS
jgi:hypothetical protein